jgi:hypothetical protein
VVGQREHGAGVSFGQLAANEHPQHLVRQLEQAQAIGDERLRTADALGHFAERKTELVDQHRVRARLLDRREILAGDVLDEREQQRVAIVSAANERRNRLDPGLAGRAPAALTRDQLVAAARLRPYDHGLQHPLVLQRLGEPGRRLRLEAPSRLAFVGSDLVDAQLYELGRVATAADENLQAATEPTPGGAYGPPSGP